MKRIILLLALFGLFQTTSNALVQGTIKQSVANSFKVTIKNIDAVTIAGNFAQYNAAIRVAQTAPQPTLVLTNLMAVGNVSIIGTYTAGGYTYYNIYYEAPTGVPNNVSLTQNTELDIFSGTFTSGVGSAQVDLVDTWMATDFTGVSHTGTGTSQFTQFYINIQPSGPNGDATNYAARFYSNAQSTAATNASTTSFVGLLSVPLSVSLSKIEAVKEKTSAIVKWTTASEMANTGFDIERSIDGKTFAKIGFEKSKAINGNSSLSIDYSFTDARPLAGVNYYRLKQIDQDGRFVYSQVVNVAFDNNTGIRVYPNPATDKVIVEGSNISSVSVYNAMGQLVKVPATIGASGRSISLGGLAKGMYTLHIETSNGQTVQKIILQ